DLVEVVRGAVEDLSPVIGEHRLTLDLPDEPLPMRGNPDVLHGLALNLIDNARRHTPPGSVIHIGLKRLYDNALLEVSDSGPGIPVEMRSQIFSRFVRDAGGPSDRSRGHGTGLGLAIVDASAHAHGG